MHDDDCVGSPLYTAEAVTKLGVSLENQASRRKLDAIEPEIARPWSEMFALEAAAHQKEVQALGHERKALELRREAIALETEALELERQGEERKSVSHALGAEEVTPVPLPPDMHTINGWVFGVALILLGAMIFAIQYANT